MTLFTEISFTKSLGYELRQTETKNGFEIVLTHKPTKTAVFRCSASFIDNSKNLVSVDVYRSSDYEHYDALRGIADTVIFDYVMKSHAIVINELQQNATGSRFWGYCISKAAAIGLHVYHLPNKSCIISVMPIMEFIGTTEGTEK